MPRLRHNESRIVRVGFDHHYNNPEGGVSSMKLGAYIFPTAYTISMVDLARALEERGFESLFVPEHTHIPSSRRSPWPGGAELPREYSNTLDPFVGLAAAAAVTTTLRIGTGICLLTERDPIVTAKEVASLDLISGGRFELGIGAGWNAEEMENHGTVFDTRFKVMVDRCKAMQSIWENDEATYKGKFASFDAIWSWPKPVQSPLPVLLGGESVHTLRRVVDFCTGWLPRGRDFGDPQKEMTRLWKVADEAGRDRSTISVSLFGSAPDAEFLKRCADAGVNRALFTLPSEGRDQTLALLDRLRALMP